jgi:hypothetical protein
LQSAWHGAYLCIVEIDIRDIAAGVRDIDRHPISQRYVYRGCAMATGSRDIKNVFVAFAVVYVSWPMRMLNLKL